MAPNNNNNGNNNNNNNGSSNNNNNDNNNDNNSYYNSSNYNNNYDNYSTNHGSHKCLLNYTHMEHGGRKAIRNQHLSGTPRCAYTCQHYMSGRDHQNVGCVSVCASIR
ncbi:unnamed protein product [Polarella glacialis]|uniref:Uncharacterized protein n=1 Tax=Polarella glacialis TaxID=89957 RepID=A0A813EVD0_POLGL|nr:unnamed protein product [Polarella glacialis]